MSNLSTLGGSVTDNFGLVASVVFSIHEQDINYGAGRWWNGTNFQSSCGDAPGIRIGEQIGCPRPVLCCRQLNSGQSYDLTVMATDTISNSASTTITVTDVMTVLAWVPGQTPVGTVALKTKHQRRQLLVPNHPAKPRRRGLAHGFECACRARRAFI